MSRLALVAAFALAVMPLRAGATSPPSGTISCSMFPTNAGLDMRPAISSDPSTGRILVKTSIAGICDNSGVVGGKAPITAIDAKLVGTLTAGTTCSSFVNAPNFDRLRVKIKWKAAADAHGRSKVVSSTTLSFVDVSWDEADEALILSSQPSKGGFAGSTATLKITLNNAAYYNGPCQPPILGAGWGADGESAITIP